MGSLRNVFSSRFRKAVVLVVAVALISGASVYAYFSSLPPPLGPRASIMSPPVELSVALDRNEYLLGENLTITFCLRNTSNKSIELAWPSAAPIGSDPVIATEFEGVYDTVQPVPSMANGTLYTVQVTGLFHFGASFEEENGTQFYFFGAPGLLHGVYKLTFEPNGYIRQTVNLAFYIYEFQHRNLAFPRAGTFQIRGVLANIGISGVGGTTIETPPIAFMLVQR